MSRREQFRASTSETHAQEDKFPAGSPSSRAGSTLARTFRVSAVSAPARSRSSRRRWRAGTRWSSCRRGRARACASSSPRWSWRVTASVVSPLIALMKDQAEPSGGASRPLPSTAPSRPPSAARRKSDRAGRTSSSTPRPSSWPTPSSAALLAHRHRPVRGRRGALRQPVGARLPARVPGPGAGIDDLGHPPSWPDRHRDPRRGRRHPVAAPTSPTPRSSTPASTGPTSSSAWSPSREEDATSGWSTLRRDRGERRIVYTATVKAVNELADGSRQGFDARHVSRPPEGRRPGREPGSVHAGRGADRRHQRLRHGDRQARPRFVIHSTCPGRSRPTIRKPAVAGRDGTPRRARCLFDRDRREAPPLLPGRRYPPPKTCVNAPPRPEAAWRIRRRAWRDRGYLVPCPRTLPQGLCSNLFRGQGIVTEDLSGRDIRRLSPS